ncbi:PREDICTED: GPI transamidase component PIG-T [Drosophila arizonae]|uniref:GPI transamidase component PIG-T n=1 Tax=Drosophila arizonae TaxID=7263 RepID=A0ABM1PPU9_DROAR|nr:PREDICTED: GPI transamidase component PIG-T [Drosophila arizonae]
MIAELALTLLLLLSPLALGQTQIPQFQYQTDEQFHEELVVRPLAGDHVNTYFQFTTRWHYGVHKNLYHTQLTPRVIAEILQTYDVKELHIGLTQGLWRYETWGYPIVEATGGAELWAWFSSPNLTDDSVNKQWMRLANVFSGILCASLNFVDNTNSIAPKHIFRPQFMESGNRSHQFVRYATLPREIVCTENLTPWKKLLPCGSASGLATLLNSGYIHNTKYHSLGVKVRTLCDSDDPSNCLVELTQTANLVYDLKLLEQSNTDFSLRRLFGMGLNGYCEMASSSKIYVQLNEQGERFQLTPTPQEEVLSTVGGHNVLFGVYDIQQQFEEPGARLFNIAWLGPKGNSKREHTSPPPLYAHRYLLGNGQKHGRIATEVTNTHYEPLPVVLMELVPWYVHAYLHTLRISSKPQHLHEYTSNELKFSLLHYAPGKQRELPTHLEIGFMLPARSSALITIEVDYLLLKWLEYPPDANHGHYIGSAVIGSQLPIGRNYTALPLEGYLFQDSFNASQPAYALTLRTEALIVSLPTPDFSMPYNVICLACTVVALAFGPIHSVATKLIIVERQTTIPRNLLRKVVHKLTSRFSRRSTNTVLNEQQNNEQNGKGKEKENEQEEKQLDQTQSCDKQAHM